MSIRLRLALALDRIAWGLLRADARATCRRDGHQWDGAECQRCEVTR